jgi:hypothetical protein
LDDSQSARVVKYVTRSRFADRYDQLPARASARLLAAKRAIISATMAGASRAALRPTEPMDRDLQSSEVS